jgi:hypothetical protein
MGKITNCLLTGIPIQGEVRWGTKGNVEIFWYLLKINDNTIGVSLCRTLYEELSWSDSETSKFLKANQSLLIGEFAKDGFQSLHRKVFHFECDTENKPNHFRLKDFIEEIISKGDYPKSTRDKYNNLIKFLYQSQDVDGSDVFIKRVPEYYSGLYFRSFDELQFFLRDMEKKDLIQYFESDDKIQFTFNGLEYIETLNKTDKLQIFTTENAEYEIALSYASEDRSYVEQVAAKLKDLGIKVFYDNHEVASLWGKDLYQYLNDIYRNQCKFCIVFVSEHYAKKLWTKHELKSAQARAFNENKKYILPARFDLTELPGMNNTVAYIDCMKSTPEDLALLAAQKINRS